MGPTLRPFVFVAKFDPFEELSPPFILQESNVIHDVRIKVDTHDTKYDSRGESYYGCYGEVYPESGGGKDLESNSNVAKQAGY